jgi:hypothetical protein
MSTWVNLFLAASTLGATAAASTALPSARVREAIEFGRSAPSDQLGQYELKTADTWLVNFDTPFLRIAQLSASLRKSEKTLAEADVPITFSANEIQIYVHARFQENARSMPNVEYVTILRPAGNGRSETVLPRDVDRFVRQVPSDKPYWGPARISKSVRASFPADALQAGGELRILFEGGRIESVTIDPALLARVR